MNYDLFFRRIAENLDLTETEFESIKSSYNAVGNCLSSSPVLSNYHIEVFPQGSVRLGTVIKPLSRDDYDVDLVCELSNNDNYLSPKNVKQLVGEALINSRYSNLLEEEHGRCWTLSYNANPPYHIDILPGLLAKNGNRINATIKRDSGQYDWLPTNPKGFADWFANISNKRMVFDESANIEKIKKYVDKTPLQRAVQLIKRHRDVYYRNNPEEGPASVVITALMGLSYNGESSIESILKNNPILWASHIKKVNGRYSIKIPSLPDDDYADKWNGEDPLAADRFFKWHSKLISDLDSLFAQTSSASFLDVSSRLFDKSSIDRIRSSNTSIIDSLDEGFRNNRLPTKIEDLHPLFNHAISISSIGHKYIPNGKTILKIEASVFSSPENREKNISVLYEFNDSSPLLKKDLYIRFAARIYNFSNPYFILWQVTNTGEEARTCKRGTFERSDLDRTKYEKTSYAGTHFVQAFLIDKYTGNCVAKSNILDVNIGAEDD